MGPVNGGQEKAPRAKRHASSAATMTLCPEAAKRCSQGRAAILRIAGAGPSGAATNSCRYAARHAPPPVLRGWMTMGTCSNFIRTQKGEAHSGDDGGPLVSPGIPGGILARFAPVRAATSAGARFAFARFLRPERRNLGRGRTRSRARSCALRSSTHRAFPQTVAAAASQALGALIRGQRSDRRRGDQPAPGALWSKAT
jgi:hypothetical protein